MSSTIRSDRWYRVAGNVGDDLTGWLDGTVSLEGDPVVTWNAWPEALGDPPPGNTAEMPGEVTDETTRAFSLSLGGVGGWLATDAEPGVYNAQITLTWPGGTTVLTWPTRGYLKLVIGQRAT